jgi:hypothetical protein
MSLSVLGFEYRPKLRTGRSLWAYSKHRRQQAVGKRIGRDPLRAAAEQERRNGQTLQFIMCSDLDRVLTGPSHQRRNMWNS